MIPFPPGWTPNQVGLPVFRAGHRIRWVFCVFRAGHRIRLHRGHEAPVGYIEGMWVECITISSCRLHRGMWVECILSICEGVSLSNRVRYVV
ncbi:unnamed protein product [Rodentolepis nana]|uniref:Cupin domain-containing protein n=1 Tax=Rodentolepis nana TaxID=102285 RepID=A0A0R3THD4_RODNA|nr:unnamed protein product [Rodentolepis nana]